MLNVYTVYIGCPAKKYIQLCRSISKIFINKNHEIYTNIITNNITIIIIIIIIIVIIITIIIIIIIATTTIIIYTNITP